MISWQNYIVKLKLNFSFNLAKLDSPTYCETKQQDSFFFKSLSKILQCLGWCLYFSESKLITLVYFYEGLRNLLKGNSLLSKIEAKKCTYDIYTNYAFSNIDIYTQIYFLLYTQPLFHGKILKLVITSNNTFHSIQVPWTPGCTHDFLVLWSEEEKSLSRVDSLWPHGL